MALIKVKDPEALVKAYADVAVQAEPVKNVTRGGADLRKLDEAGTKFELVINYSVKAGRFSKEKTVIAIVPVNRVANGVLDLNLNDVVFRSLAFKKGNFEEEWSGNLSEARAQFPDVVKAFEEDVQSLVEKLSGFN